MIFTTLSYLDEEGNLSSSCNLSIPEETLLKIYKIMRLTRHVDDHMLTLQRQGTLTFAMGSLGEEACAVASAAALDAGDWMYPQYREGGIIFWRGFTILQYINHMLGNKEDLILGRQMPNHFGSRALNVVTVSSPIGTKIPHAAGCAYAMKIQQEKQVVICYFGEGATSEGDFHVGLNFAAVRKAPVIFFCRNNGYAISTPCERQFATEGVAPEGPGHGIKTFRIDGNDVFAIYETVMNARKYCLEGKGPVLIEAMTYRLGAHSTSDDPTLYRKEEEVMKWKLKCPLIRLKKYLEKKNLWSEAKEKELVQEIEQEISKAIKAAKENPRPPLESMIEHVYFSVPENLKEELKELSWPS
jgi:pyruvate dehydrogenase E1 component alpha subunit